VGRVAGARDARGHPRATRHLFRSSSRVCHSLRAQASHQEARYALHALPAPTSYSWYSALYSLHCPKLWLEHQLCCIIRCLKVFSLQQKFSVLKDIHMYALKVLLRYYYLFYIMGVCNNTWLYAIT
jgi:hypothetical protein